MKGAFRPPSLGQDRAQEEAAQARRTCLLGSSSFLHSVLVLGAGSYFTKKEVQEIPVNPIKARGTPSLGQEGLCSEGGKPIAQDAGNRQVPEET